MFVTDKAVHSNCLVAKFYLSTPAKMGIVFGEIMGDTVKSRDAQHLVGMLESFLDELDALNMIQTAARIASAIDTLKTEIERNCDDDMEIQQVELIRAAERD